ncbi:hypothetical protein [Sorangium sp. So ce394]|uniref:hypothetical protein n=1 Tax=Sorangium sp. So ce394 TaxID=3133310 RepID=UPI003F5B162D
MTLPRVLFAGSLLVGAVLATTTSDAAVHGSICQPQYGTDEEVTSHLLSGTYGFQGASLLCPVPIEANLGSGTINFSAVVDDQTDDGVLGVMSCRGRVYDGSGNVLGTTPFASTTGVFTGVTTLNFSVNIGSGSASNSYVVECVLPPVLGGTSSNIQSGVRSVRAF